MISKKAVEAGLTKEAVAAARAFIKSWKAKDPEYIYEVREMNAVLQAVESGNFLKAEKIAEGMDGEPYKVLIFNNLLEVIGAGLKKFHPAYYKKDYGSS